MAKFRRFVIMSAIFSVMMHSMVTRAMQTRGRKSIIHIGYILHSETEDLEILNRALEVKVSQLNNDNSDLYFNYDSRRNITDVNNSFEVLNRVCTILRKNVVALIVVGTSSANELFISVARAMQVPIFLPTEMSYTMCNKTGYVFTMMPSFVDAVVDIMRFFRWESYVYYIYDSDEGLLRLQDFYQATSKIWNHREMTIRSHRIQNISDSYDLLRSVDREGNNCSCTFSCPCQRRIILDLSTKMAFNQTLEQIINVGMNRDGYHYILGTLGIDDLDLSAFEYGGVNITGFSIVNKRDTHKERNNDDKEMTYKKAMIIDTLDFIAKGIKIFGKKRTLQYKDLYQSTPLDCTDEYVAPWRNGFAFTQVLKEDTYLDNGHTGTIRMDNSGARKGHSFEVHQLGYRTPLHKIGTWSPNADPKHRFQTDMHSPVHFVTKDDLENKTWIITTIATPPFTMKATRLESEKDDKKTGYVTINGTKYEGYCIDVAEKIKERYERKHGPGSFNYKFKLVEDNEFGKLNSTYGTWNGLIGDLIDGKADMALASLTINQERQRAVDFTKPFMKIGISIMIKKPDKQKPGVFSFMKPLSTMVWLCVVVAFLGVSVVLFVVGRWSPYEWQPVAATKEQSNAFSFSNTLWFALGALMQQGSDIFPRSVSGRIVGSAWWFFTLILISSYTANLAAFLTIERLLTPIENVDDLAKQTEIEYGIRSNGATEAFFKEAKIDVYKKLWTVMSRNKDRVMVPSDDKGIEKVRKGKGKYAYLLESPVNDYTNQKKPCNTMRVGDLLDNKGYGIATPHGSPIRRNLNLVVLELREEGTLHKLEQRWWYDKGECGRTDTQSGQCESETCYGDTSKNPLTLSNVSGIFHILIAGLVLSMMMSLLEHVIHRLHRNRKERIRKMKIDNPRPAVKIEKKNPLEVLKAAGYTEHENNAYMFNPPDQLTTFESNYSADI